MRTFFAKLAGDPSERRYGKEVHGRDSLAVVIQKRSPSFCRLRIPWRFTHPAQHRSFRYVQAEHLQFTMNPWRTPSWNLSDHAKDQFAQLLACGFPSNANALPRDPVPVQLESGPMPPNDRLRLDQDQCASPSRPKSSKHHPEQFVRSGKPRLRMALSQNHKLPPERQVFQKKIAARAEKLTG